MIKNHFLNFCSYIGLCYETLHENVKPKEIVIMKLIEQIDNQTRVVCKFIWIKTLPNFYGKHITKFSDYFLVVQSIENGVWKDVSWRWD